MLLFRAIKSLVTGARDWVQETYCALGQKVAEQIETASDVIAEKRYLAEHPVPNAEAVVVPEPRAVELASYRVINGHKHPD
ncbi:MAG: hypothetical protein ACP5XB_29230 [Isosphaeraceae bacterium]|jgi:hypothetical protein